MLEQSEASAPERKLAETIALRYLASEQEEYLIPVEKAFSMAEAHGKLETNLAASCLWHPARPAIGQSAGLSRLNADH